MSTEISLVNIGGLAKVGVKLIEVIADATGVIYEPTKVRRLAKAEGEAAKIKAMAGIEIRELEQRALQRFIIEQGKKQSNMECIIEKALPQLEEDSEPKKVDEDWIMNFFDKCRLVSDEEMQQLWASVLAGEANASGSYSKRSVNLLGSLDRTDAIMFSTVCRFRWLLDDTIEPVVLDEQEEFYKQRGIDFSSIIHLSEIGLITYAATGCFHLTELPRQCPARYCDEHFTLQFPGVSDNRLNYGKAKFTSAGRELSRILDVAPVPGLVEYLTSKWGEDGVVLRQQSDESTASL